MSNSENRSLSYIKQIAEIGITTLISSYFFTVGYINSFALPIKIDFFQAGHFIITLFADSILILLFDLFLGLFHLFIKILKLPVYIYTFLKEMSNFDITVLHRIILSDFLKSNWLILIGITFAIITVFYIKLKHRNLFIKTLIPFIFIWKKIDCLYFSSKILIYYIIYIALFKILFESISLKHPFADFFYKIQKELGFCSTFASIQEKTPCRSMIRIFYDLELYVNNITTGLFMLTLLGAIFSIPIFIALNLNKNIQFKLNNRDFLSLVLFVLLSVSWSYNLGRDYLGRFIDYPTYRSNISKVDERVQIWRDKNDYFYVECKENSSSLIKGFNTKTDKMFYLGFLDNQIHPNLCPKQKKGIITKDFDDEIPFKNCYYKNSKDEVFLANNCFKVSNNVLLTPIGTLSPCHVHISKLVGVFMKKYIPLPNNAIRYHLNEEHIKHYEDNFEHKPINRYKGPISNTNFSIGKKPKWGKLYFSFKEAVELLYGYKSDTIRLAFEGISKNFPKCD